MDRTQYMDTTRERFEEWEEELDELEELISGNEEDDNDSEMETVRDLRMQLENAKLTLDELEQADEESYEEVQATLETQLEEFEESMEEAREMLKED